MNTELIKKYLPKEPQKWVYKRIYNKYSNYNDVQEKIKRELEISKILRNIAIVSLIIEILFIVIFQLSLLKYIILPLLLSGTIMQYQKFKYLNSMNKLFEELEKEKENKR